MTVPVVLAGVLAAIIWNRITWWFALPSSSSHALVGGLMGAVILSGGFTAIHFDGLIKVLLALFLAPPLGFIAGFIILRLFFYSARRLTANQFYVSPRADAYLYRTWLEPRHE